MQQPRGDVRRRTFRHRSDSRRTYYVGQRCIRKRDAGLTEIAHMACDVLYAGERARGGGEWVRGALPLGGVGA